MGIGVMGQTLGEARHALRGLGRAPGMTVVAVSIMALAIGANTAVFSLVSGILAGSATGVREEGLFEADELLDQGPALLSPKTFREWHTARTAQVVAYAEGEMTWTGGSYPVLVPSASVSAGFFGVVGARPALGRAFTEQEDRPAGSPVAMVSYGFWQRALGGGPSPVGRTIQLDDRSFEVVGVLPEGFRFPGRADVWTPFGPNLPDIPGRGARFVQALVRPAPGRSAQEVEQELTSITAASDDHPAIEALLTPRRVLEVANVRTALLILMGSVAVVLLIAAFNVGNLLLARALRRSRDVAVRTALGASRWRIIEGFVAEGVLMGLAGGLLGILVATVGTEIVSPLLVDLPGLDRVTVDSRVLAFNVAVSLLVGVLAGIVPAFRAARQDPAQMLKEEQGGTQGPKARVLRQGLVAVQVALAVVLLTEAGVMVRSLSATLNQNLGFASADRTSFTLVLPQSRYPDGASRARFVASLEEALRANPSVTMVTATDNLPIGGRHMVSGVNDLGGGGVEALGSTEVEAVQPGYFRAMEIPVRSGRVFVTGDRDSVEPVAVVNEAFVRQLLDGEPAVGRQAQVGFGGGKTRRIVGVVADVRHQSLTESPGPKLYLPLDESMGSMVFVLMSSRLDFDAEVEYVRNTLRSLDPDLPLSDAATFEDLVARTVARPRSYAVLLATFGALALALALAGFYATLSGMTAERRREMGIRIALGADNAGVRRLVLRDALAVTGVGLILGWVATLGAGRVLESLLFGVRSTDPMAAGGAALLLLITALAATYHPARRATEVDVVEALSGEG